MGTLQVTRSKIQLDANNSKSNVLKLGLQRVTPEWALFELHVQQISAKMRMLRLIANNVPQLGLQRVTPKWHTSSYMFNKSTQKNENALTNSKSNVLELVFKSVTLEWAHLTLHDQQN